MAETLDAIIRRVKKLLSLAESDNQHEAAAAAAQAQRLLTLHGLEAAELEKVGTETVGSGGAIQIGATLDKWRGVVADAVATDDLTARRHGQLAGKTISPNDARAALGADHV